MATLQSNYSQELLDTYNRHHCAQSRTDQETKNHVKTAKKFAGACSITTKMIIFTITIAHYFALHGVQKRFLLLEGCFSTRPWLAIQHPTKCSFHWICRANSPPVWAPRRRMLCTNFQAGWASETLWLPQCHRLSQTCPKNSSGEPWGWLRRVTIEAELCDCHKKQIGKFIRTLANKTCFKTQNLKQKKQHQSFKLLLNATSHHQGGVLHRTMLWQAPFRFLPRVSASSWHQGETNNKGIKRPWIIRSSNGQIIKSSLHRIHGFICPFTTQAITGRYCASFHSHVSECLTVQKIQAANQISCQVA